MKYITPSETSALVVLERLPKSEKKAAFQQLLADPNRKLSKDTKRAARIIVGLPSTKKAFRFAANKKRK